MPKNNSSINNSLFDLLKGKGYSPTVLSTAGKEIPTPDEAEVFQFNFVKDGEDYGKVTLTIDDSSNLIVYYSDDVADSEKETSTESGDLSWYGLLNQLKRFAQRYQLSFELRNTDNLKSDMAKRDYMKKQDQIAESRRRVSEMDNRTPSGDRREQRANSPEAIAQREKEQQAELKKVSPEMRKKLRLPEPDKEDVAEDIASTRREGNLKKKIDKGVATPEQKREYQELKAKNMGPHFLKSMGRPVPKQDVAEGSPGQAAWKKEMLDKGAVKFWRDQHGGGTVDRIIAKDKDGNIVGAFNRKGVAEGLGKDIKRLATGKDVKSRAGQEIAKSQDASMKGDTKTSKKHFDRYDKLDKLANKEQGVAEGTGAATQVLSDIVANEDFDALYDLMSSDTEAGKIVQRMYNDVSGEEGLHPDDDFEKILSIVLDHLTQDYGQQNMAEGSKESYIIVRTDTEGKKDVFAGGFDTYEQAQKELDDCLAHPLHTKYKQKFEIKRKGQQDMAEGNGGHAGSAKVRYTGGMHGEYDPTKKQASPQAHLDAAKYHNDEANKYIAAMNHPKSDQKNKEWYKNKIQHHKNKADFHIQASGQQGVAEGLEDRKTAPGWHSGSVKNPNFNDELSARRVSPPGARLKSGKLSADERGSQERTKALMKFKHEKGGLTGPKGVLPEEQGVAEAKGDEYYDLTAEHVPAKAIPLIKKELAQAGITLKFVKKRDSFSDETVFEIVTGAKGLKAAKDIIWKYNNGNYVGIMNEQDMAEGQESMKQVSEGYYPMGKQGSYSDAVPTTKIIIQHSRRIEEGEQRYRNIAKIFVENSEGERFAVPTNKPGLARVYARHIAEGGTPYDERGRHITSLVEEYSKMSGFMRATRGKQFNESAQKLVTEAVNYYQSLRESLSKMTGHRGYSAYFESWTPALMEDGEEQETNLNELFVQETLDPRIESVMPILGKLQRKLGNIKQVDELAEWADNIIEGDGGQEALNSQGIPEAAGAETLAHNIRTDRSNLKAFDLEETTDVTDYNPKSQGGTRAELLRKYANTKRPKDAEAARRAGASQSELKAAADSTEEIHEGASSQDLQNAILYRVEMRHPDLVSKYGHEYVADKALDVASFYAGAEEIGSSDISAMVRHLVDTLKREGENGLDENLDANQIRAGQLGPTEKVGPQGAVGKLVGANESVNESFKKKYNTDIKLSWSSLDEGLSVSDKLHIFEEYYTKGNLTESNNQDTTDYFVSLFSLSDKPTKNKKYIVVPLSLVGDRILPLDKSGYMEYLGKGTDTQLVFKSTKGEVRYPSETMRKLSIFYTFTFQTQEAYDKFRTALTLKFGVDLPNIKLTKMEEDLGANESVNESEDELARILQMVKHKR